MKDVYDKHGIALAIPAVDMSTYRSWVFKTPHLSGSSGRDNDYTLVDVCLASSAAPIYRSLAAVDVPHGNGIFNVFADGGLWANNPALVALAEALAMVEHGRSIEIYCLGTCSKPEGEVLGRAGAHRGLIEWSFGGRAVGLAIAAQEFAFDNLVRLLRPHLKTPCEVVRFPSNKIPAALHEYLELDETRPQGLDALIRQAEKDADMTNSLCNDVTSHEGKLIRRLFESMPRINH